MKTVFLHAHKIISDARLEHFISVLRTSLLLDANFLDEIFFPNTMIIECDEIRKEPPLKEEPFVSDKTFRATSHGVQSNSNEVRNLIQYHFYRNNIYVTICVPVEHATDETMNRIILSLNKTTNEFYENESYPETNSKSSS